MALVFEPVYTDGIAQLSYLVGDDAAGLAAVVDPRRDIDVYLDLARERGLRIAHIVETHIHADFVSGARELQARTAAPIHGGRSDAYGFAVLPLGEGDGLVMGGVRLGALHTPGHTPEHVSLLLSDTRQGEQPFAVLTGDTLFNRDVGRPDLLGGGTEQRLAGQLYHSLFDTLLPLGDRMEVYPCHGAGSACGKAIGDRRRSTIGNERLFNPALQPRSEDAFRTWLLSGMPEPPRHYAHLKRVNAAGAPIRGAVPVVPPLDPDAFEQAMGSADTLVVDARAMLAFGGGHIPGALNIGLSSSFPNWIGWMVPPDRRLLLVLDGPQQVDAATRHLFRIGLDSIVGYLQGGMARWQESGRPLDAVPQWTVHDLADLRQRPEVTVLDVRSDQEFQQDRIPDATHITLPHLAEQLDRLDRNRTIATYCGSGYRASIAASILKRHGFPKVAAIPGSWKAWTAAGLPTAEAG